MRCALKKMTVKALDNPYIKRKNEWVFVLEFLTVAAAALVLILVFQAYVSTRWPVENVSMQPAFNNSTGYTNTNEPYDSAYTTRLSKIKRGDIIVFTHNGYKDGKDSLIKRAIALGGDTIRFEKDGAGETIVMLKLAGGGDFELIPEPYRIGKMDENSQYMKKEWSKFNTDYEIPAGQCFAMGDNRDHSHDCRSIGPFPVSRVEGKVYMRVPGGEASLKKAPADAGYFKVLGVRTQNFFISSGSFLGGIWKLITTGDNGL